MQTRVMDGHALKLADDSFDVVASQYGVMLFTDLPRGVAEMVRVTRPGGWVLLTVFGPPEDPVRESELLPDRELSPSPRRPDPPPSGPGG